MRTRAYRLAALIAALAVLWSFLAAPGVYAYSFPGVDSPGYTASDSDARPPDADGPVYLIGEPAGIRLSSGVIISDTAGVITETGTICPAGDAGLLAGDIVTAVDGLSISSSEQLVHAVKDSGGSALELSVRHADGSEDIITVTPVLSAVDRCYRAGLWIRDSTSGIGVITFMTPGSMVFGAVGHPLSDDDSPVPSGPCSGTLCSATLTGVRKGRGGTPGELVGYLDGTELGTVSRNAAAGVFGTVLQPEALKAYSGKAYRAAAADEVREGPAELLIRLPGEHEAKLYSVVIETVSGDRSHLSRNMVIRVTDRALLRATGGIVQGMSGSPIIQNGRFAAVLTHVFVSDPTRGYAIFAENMINYIDTM